MAYLAVGEAKGAQAWLQQVLSRAMDRPRWRMRHRWASRRAPCEARGLRGKLNRSSHSQGLTRGGGQACKLTFGKEDAARTGPAVLRGGPRGRWFAAAWGRSRPVCIGAAMYGRRSPGRDRRSRGMREGMARSGSAEGSVECAGG